MIQIRARSVLAALIGLFLLSACGDNEAPSAAHGRLTEALGALAAGDRARFKEAVLSAQRSGSLGIEDGTGFPTDVIAKNLTLDEILALPFFTQVKSAKIDSHSDSQVKDGSAQLVTLLDYGNRTVASRSWQMVKRGEAWFIDMKATIRLWQIANGPSAFTALRRAD